MSPILKHDMACTAAAFLLWLPTLALSLTEEGSPSDSPSCPGRSILQTRVLDGTVRTYIEKCTTVVTPLELVFLVDGSGSVGSDGFAESKAFLKDVVGGLSLGTASTETRVAVVQFATGVETEIGLGSGTSEQAVVQAIDGMQHADGMTNTAGGIEYAVEDTFSHARPDAAKVLAVILDGVPSEGFPDPQAAADSARSQGIDVVAIGVGSAIGGDELQKIAGSGGKVMTVDSYSDLWTLVSNTSKTVCEKVSTAKPTPAPTPRPTPMPTPSPYHLARKVCAKNDGHYVAKLLVMKIGGGVLFHSKDFYRKETMCYDFAGQAQYTPVHIDVQVLGGFSNGKPKPQRRVGTVAYSSDADKWQTSCTKWSYNWRCR